MTFTEVLEGTWDFADFLVLQHNLDNFTGVRIIYLML